MGRSLELLDIDIVLYKAGDDTEGLEDDNNTLCLTLDGKMTSLDCLTGADEYEYIATEDFYYIFGKGRHEDTAISTWIDCMSLAELFGDDEGPDLLRLVQKQMDTGSTQTVCLRTFATLLFDWHVLVTEDAEGYKDADEEWYLLGALDERAPKVDDPWTAKIQLSVSA